MNKPLFIISALLLSASVFAVPLCFDAPADSTKTFQASAYHGETLEIEAQLTWRNAPLALQGDASATMLWQTNGMHDAWWSAPASVSRAGLVSATWTPTNDVGADLYRVFLLVSGDGGTSYRANILLRLLGSPGATPNSLPLPVPVLDFAKITVTNAPWGEGGIAEETDPVFGEWKESAGIAMGQGATIGNHSGYGVAIGAYSGADMYGTAVGSEDEDGNAAYAYGNGTVQLGPGSNLAEGTLNFRHWQLVMNDGKIPLERLPANVATSDSLGTAAYKDASEFATAADEALVYQLLMGSNVVAEVTNYNSRVRAPSFRLLQLDPDTKEYFTVWAETNGLSRTLNEAKAHTDAATNALARAKADRAWSHHTSGLGADAPAGVTWISTPETVIAGGYEYAKQVTTHGEVWVLTSNGLGLGADTNSFFAVKSGDGETLFSIEKTDSVLVGVDADGISVSGGVVTIPVGVVSQDPPVCYAANSLVNATWTDLTQAPLPAWVTSATCTGTPGAWVWTIETTAPSAFFQFRVLQPGATVIRNNAQTDLSAGILINGTRFYPHINGGTLTWTTTP